MRQCYAENRVGPWGRFQVFHPEIFRSVIIVSHYKKLQGIGEEMFLRRMGRKILVLHSYRDGSGRVCQRRLADFDSADEAAERLADRGWRNALQERYPELVGQAERLPARLACLPGSRKRIPVTRGREQKVGSALRTLLRLTQEAPSLKAQVAVALLELSQLDLPIDESPRTCWDSRDPKGAAQCAALENQASLLESQDRLEESCQVRGRLAARFPGESTWADYGESLQRLGRGDEALEQYARLTPRDSLRHYQMASVLIAQDKKREGLHHLALGMNRDRDIAEALVHIEKGVKACKGGQYWERYGHLWDAPARKFFLNVYQQSVVKMTLSRDQRLGVRRRRVFREHATTVILEQARDGVTHRLL